MNISDNLGEKLNESYNKKLGQYILTSKLLGQGSYAKVYLGYLEKNESQKLAIKKIQCPKINSKQFDQVISREIKILQKLNHPNIVKLYDVFNEEGLIYICFELCNGGDLKQLLRKNNTMSTSEVYKLFIEIVSAYKTLYEKNIIHRDLKPANILFDDKKNSKLSDFGFAREIYTGMETPEELTLLGSPLYMAPQILNKSKFSSKSDIWSLGIILYQCLYGRTPWTAMTPNDLLKNIETKNLRFLESNDISEEWINLISSMLKYHEEDRIGWEDLFIKKIESEENKFKEKNEKNKGENGLMKCLCPCFF